MSDVQRIFVQGLPFYGKDLDSWSSFGTESEISHKQTQDECLFLGEEVLVREFVRGPPHTGPDPFLGWLGLRREPNT